MTHLTLLMKMPFVIDLMAITVLWFAPVVNYFGGFVGDAARAKPLDITGTQNSTLAGRSVHCSELPLKSLEVIGSYTPLPVKRLFGKMAPCTVYIMPRAADISTAIILFMIVYLVIMNAVTWMKPRPIQMEAQKEEKEVKAALANRLISAAARSTISAVPTTCATPLIAEPVMSTIMNMAIEDLTTNAAMLEEPTTYATKLATVSSPAPRGLRRVISEETINTEGGVTAKITVGTRFNIVLIKINVTSTMTPHGKKQGPPKPVTPLHITGLAVKWAYIELVV